MSRPVPGAPADYDHAQAFQALLGIRDANWFLEKARRELGRYDAAGDDVAARTDALLNYAHSLIALEDWTQPGGDIPATEWRHRHRSASPAYGLMCLVALLAKHRSLREGRLPNLRIEQTDELHVWSEDARPGDTIEVLQIAMPEAVVRTVRTHVEDDEIVGYTIVLGIPGLRVNGVTMTIPTVMKVAWHYWQGVLAPPAPV